MLACLAHSVGGGGAYRKREQGCEGKQHCDRDSVVKYDTQERPSKQNPGLLAPKLSTLTQLTSITA